MATPINIAERLATLETQEQARAEAAERDRTERRSDRRAILAIAVTVAIALASAIFWAGYQNARLDNVETLLREVRDEIRHRP